MGFNEKMYAYLNALLSFSASSGGLKILLGAYQTKFVLIPPG